MNQAPIIVTGGAGFIGSAVVREALDQGHGVVVLDKLTYAGNLASLADCESNPAYRFERADVCDRAALKRIFSDYQPRGVIHLAAESHVDRSIDGPLEFVRTNIDGTCELLEAARAYLAKVNPAAFRFLHVSTDEVFGDLASTGEFFSEETPYRPSSPYAASKAASDHLVRAWGRTFGLPVVVTHCSNNHGPRQFPEKLIPHMILCALAGKPLPVYGDGNQIRDWLYVEDHARALLTVFQKAREGETYNIGGGNEKRNIEVIVNICDLLEELAADRKPPGINLYRDLITFVQDRPGHDRRYAIDASKIERDLGWRPAESFDSGLRKTVRWFLENESWWRSVLDGTYRLQRLGQVS